MTRYGEHTPRDGWKKGVLVANAFLKTEKFAQHYEWLRGAAGQYHIDLQLLDNTKLLYPLGGSVYGAMEQNVTAFIKQNDFILYWDKDIPLGKLLQYQCRKERISVFNSIEAIEVCDNKFETYRRLWEWNDKCGKEEEIPLIPTIAAPMTYENIGYNNMSFVQDVILELGVPMVLKECYGSFGMQVYLAKTEQEVYSYTKRLAGKPFLYQKYMEQSSGRDVRIQVVGDRAVAAMYRFSQNGDFRANITNGGSMRTYKPSSSECALAVRAVKALGLDFAGVDLLFGSGETGEADIVCEINSNAHFKNMYTCTGVDVADCIMGYINGKIGGILYRNGD